MATHLVHRSLPRTLNLASFLSRYISTSASLSTAPSRSSLFLIHRLRPLVGAAGRRFSHAMTLLCFARRPLRNPNPTWSNRWPKKAILGGSFPDGSEWDLDHWLVSMYPPDGEPTRDEIIDTYIRTLAMAVGSEKEARRMIYSVSTRYSYYFGVRMSLELYMKLTNKIIILPRVRGIQPDLFVDLNKSKSFYGGEPFIGGQAWPYHPRYHEKYERGREYVRRYLENYERCKEYVRNCDIQRGMPNQATGVPASDAPSPPNMGPQSNMGGVPPNTSPSNNCGTVPPSNNYGGSPNSNYSGGLQGNYYGGAPQGNYHGGGPQGNYYGGVPQGIYHG